MKSLLFLLLLSLAATAQPIIACGKYNNSKSNCIAQCACVWCDTLIAGQHCTFYVSSFNDTGLGCTTRANDDDCKDEVLSWIAIIAVAVFIALAAVIVLGSCIVGTTWCIWNRCKHKNYERIEKDTAEAFSDL